jgi:hypothetical protein
MKVIRTLLLVLIFLSSCSLTSKTGALVFIDPTYTFDELYSMAGEYDLTNFIDKYEFSIVEPDGRFSQIRDVLWLNGHLYVVDQGEDIGDGGLHVLDTHLNILKSVNYTPDDPVISPYALAADENGKVYVAMNMNIVSNDVVLFIAVFNDELDYERRIRFTIKSNSISPQVESLAINPKGGFFLTLKANENGEEGRIYGVAEDGKVTVGIGNKSFGYLLNHSDNVYFVNSGFVTIFDRGSGGYSSQPGLSTLYRLHNGAVVSHVTLPPAMYLPLSDEEIEEYAQVFKEVHGVAPTNEYMSDLRSEGELIRMMNGSGGLFRLGNDIAILTQNANFMHVFSYDLTYLYSQRLDSGLAGNYRELFAENRLRTGIAACADDEGNIYIVQRIICLKSGTTGYGIIKGTLNR